MTAEEVVRIVRAAVSLGINRVKLTGGEPLLRPDIVDIVRGLTQISGLRDLSMTTNGTRLSLLAEPLHKAGLMRANVNIPSLNEKTYHELSGGNLSDVLDGVNAAVKADLRPVKLNMLVLRCVNEHEITDMIEFAGKTNTILQLLELEPVNVSDRYYLHYHYPLDAFEEDLKKQALEVETRDDMQNRHVYSLPSVKVEVVHPIENTDFCAHCTRLRVTSDGMLKPCLMVSSNLVDVLTPIRKGTSDDELRELFVTAVKRREPYYKPLKKN
jgi:cyclic pyranopterin phosphate synthase